VQLRAEYGNQAFEAALKGGPFAQAVGMEGDHGSIVTLGIKQSIGFFQKH
jgi:hypothetical protein